MTEDIGFLTSSLRSSIRELLGTIDALEHLATDDGEYQMTPEEEARIVRHLAERFEVQLIRDLTTRLAEHPPRNGDSMLNLSFHWRVRAEIAREAWLKADRSLDRRIKQTELPPEASARLERRIRGFLSVFLVRPDSLRQIN